MGCARAQSRPPRLARGPGRTPQAAGALTARAQLALFAAAGAAAAVALRIWTLTSPLGALDADEAVWGLMARAVWDGELPVFYWDQAYGGSQEVLLTAPLAWGYSATAIRIVPMALFALACMLVWRIGRRTIGEPAAVAAAVFLAVWPPYLVWKSTRAHGFYGAALVLSLLMLLFALRFVDRRSSWDAAGLGLAIGAGLWATPLTVGVALPTVAWVLVRVRVDARLWPVAPAAVVGALPWLVWNIRHDLGSLEAPAEPFGTDYVDFVRTFVVATLPQILGLRTPFSLDWVAPEPLARVVCVAALALLASMIVRDPDRALIGAVAIVYPLVAAFNPLAGLNTEPRYLVFFAPLVALALADVVGRRLLSAALTAGVLVALSIYGLRELMQQEPVVPQVGGMRTPAELEPALSTLERLGLRRVRAPYAVAYRITFESGERIIAAATTRGRREEYQRIVEREPRPAFVFVAGSPADRAFAGRGYRRITAGDWAVYAPAQR